MRPYFCYLGYLASGGKALEVILPVLLGLELFHTFALIHDDVMDQADMRRGGSTIHAYFTQNLRIRQLADSLALLAGDLCFIWAQEMWSRLPSNSTTYKAKKIFDRMIEEVIYGQILDVWGPAKQDYGSLDPILKMYEFKSGNYSVQKPLLIGACLAQANPALINSLLTYGEAVGLAFQLKDDLLGVFGEIQKTGKSNSDDIKEGKWTLLVALIYAKLSNKDKKQLLSTLGNRKSTSAQIDWVRQKFISTGAGDEIDKKMIELVETAKHALEGVMIKNKQELIKVADFVIKRTE
jgi:geranylgeranyl diphosphate synthase type I